MEELGQEVEQLGQVQAEEVGQESAVHLVVSLEPGEELLLAGPHLEDRGDNPSLPDKSSLVPGTRH